MNVKNFFMILSFMALPLFAEADNGHITVVKVPQSKYNASAQLKITSPHILKKNTPILVLVSNFPIGVDVQSQALTDLKVPVNSAGSRILLLFNNGKRLYVTKDDVNLLITQRSYFNKRFRINLPQDVYQSLTDTSFVISSLLVNSYGESIKNENAFYSDVYSYSNGNPSYKKIEKEIKNPYIIYNEPYGTVSQDGVLLDFYVRHATISSDEYKVDLYIDGKKIVRLLHWNPYVIQNLPKGKHDIRIQLIDPADKPLNNPISNRTSTIYVK